MPSSPLPPSEPGNISTVLERLNRQKIEGFFALRKKGAWIEEIKQCRGKLKDREELLDHITPEARKSGKYSTRTSVLLLSGGLESNSKDFTLAKDVMKQLIAQNRPDVVTWTLVRFYKEQFREYKDKIPALMRQVKDGEVILPDDYHKKVNLLRELDQYEWVGDKEQNDKFQTSLKPITDEVVKAIGVIKPERTIQPIIVEPPVVAPPQTLSADTEAIKKIRADLQAAEASAQPEPAPTKPATIRKFQPGTPEAALLSKGIPEQLIRFAKDQGDKSIECLLDLAKLDFAGRIIQIAPRITGAIGSDVQSRFITENKFFQAALDSLYGRKIRGGQAYAVPMVGLCDYILAQVDKKPKNPYIRDMAFHLMTNITGNIHSEINGGQRQVILQRLIGLTEAFVGKNLNPVEMGLVNSLDGNEKIFNEQREADLFSDALLNEEGLRPGAFEALNDPGSASFLGHLQESKEDKPNQAFFYNLKSDLSAAGYEIDAQENNFKVVRKSSPKLEAPADKAFELARQLTTNTYAEIMELGKNADLNKKLFYNEVLEERMITAVDERILGRDARLVYNNNFTKRALESFISNLNIATITKNSNHPQQAQFEATARISYGDFLEKAETQRIAIPTMTYEQFVEKVYSALKLTETPKQQMEKLFAAKTYSEIVTLEVGNNEIMLRNKILVDRVRKAAEHVLEGVHLDKLGKKVEVSFDFVVEKVNTVILGRLAKREMKATESDARSEYEGFVAKAKAQGTTIMIPYDRFVEKVAASLGVELPNAKKQNEKADLVEDKSKTGIEIYKIYGAIRKESAVLFDKMLKIREKYGGSREKALQEEADYAKMDKEYRNLQSQEIAISEDIMEIEDILIPQVLGLDVAKLLQKKAVDSNEANEYLSLKANLESLIAGDDNSRQAFSRSLSQFMSRFDIESLSQNQTTDGFLKRFKELLEGVTISANGQIVESEVTSSSLFLKEDRSSHKVEITPKQQLEDCKSQLSNSDLTPFAKRDLVLKAFKLYTDSGGNLDLFPGAESKLYFIHQASIAQLVRQPYLRDLIVILNELKIPDAQVKETVIQLNDEERKLLDGSLDNYIYSISKQVKKGEYEFRDEALYLAFAEKIKKIASEVIGKGGLREDIGESRWKDLALSFMMIKVYGYSLDAKDSSTVILFRDTLTSLFKDGQSTLPPEEFMEKVREKFDEGIIAEP